MMTSPFLSLSPASSLSAARWLGLAARGTGEIAADVEELLNHVRFDDGRGVIEEAAGSLLQYGLRCYAGRHADEAFLAGLARDITAALRQFEPRLVPESIEVQPLEPARHVRSLCRLRLRARLNGQPPGEEDGIDWRIRFDAHFGAITIDQGLLPPSSPGVRR